ncbi:MAG TPA: glutamate formimidoyltransferase [Thermoplasmata archaeon]|nr:glutamate formimidoyltransferase [Thermoplasmata archaeon]
MKLFESVPNFSEGRNAAVVDEIAGAARSVAGVTVLDIERNGDHNRSVISLAGAGAPLVEALFRMFAVAVRTIDLTRHHGEHPRMGAVDVVPFVPIGEATVPEAVELANRLAQRVWSELNVPVYLYGQAAVRDDHRDLSEIRKGQFEGIRASIATESARRPDVGAPAVHPTAGIVAIGVRPVLIAYNVNLATPDVAIAKQIAHAVRERDGGLPAVKALGFEIRERNLAQVSMNLTDYRTTSIPKAFDAVRSEAEKRGTTVADSEIVGLVPEDALVDAAEAYLRLGGFDRRAILERRLETVGGPAPPAVERLSGLSIESFVQRLAARTPTPGGGSASAAAGAVGVGLARMVLAYSSKASAPEPELARVHADLEDDQRALVVAVDEDAAAYESVRVARRAAKARPDDVQARTEWLAAVRRAAEVPLSVARRVREVGRRLTLVRERTNPNVASDLVTSIALLDAARVGALANVRVNLAELRAEGEAVDTMERESAQIATGAAS